jgi:hypothetical protein
MKDKDIRLGKIGIILGCLCILLGIIGFLFQNEIDSNGKMIPMGIMVLAFGLYLKRGSPGTFICTSCLKVSYQNRLKENKCPFCNGDIELLKGFYDRHPDLKNKM